MNKREDLQIEIKNKKYSFGELGSMTTDEGNFYTSIETLDYRFSGCPRQYKCLSDSKRYCDGKDVPFTDIKKLIEFNNKNCILCWKNALGE